MPGDTYVDAIRDRVLIRLDTLIRLRWYAIIGQLGAVLVVAFGFQFSLPWEICLVLIAVSAGLNLLLGLRYKSNHRLLGDGAFWLLAFDILQLALLLYLTGGLQNPFAILLMAPVVVSSTSLETRHILILGAVTIGAVSLLAFYHLPLPWNTEVPLKLPSIFIAGMWVAIVCTLAFTAIYAFRVAEEARRLADALTATELIMQREQHLTALDGLAAAAAHELGTPLATIALVSKEMVNSLPEGSPLREDAQLLRSQAQRCRDILSTLTSLSSHGEPIIEHQTLSAVIEEVVAPLRDFEVDIQIVNHGDLRSLPKCVRNPGIHYGLGNLIDNAVDFATKKVTVDARWDPAQVEIVVRDDGPGFPTAILSRLGEPFVTARRSRKGSRARGMGLGLFIAKTLLERSGAEITLANQPGNSTTQTGAMVSVVWPRERFEDMRPAAMGAVKEEPDEAKISPQVGEVTI